MAEEYDRPLLPVKAKIDPGSAGPRQIKIPLNSAKTAKTASTSALLSDKTLLRRAAKNEEDQVRCSGAVWRQVAGPGDHCFSTAMPQFASVAGRYGRITGYT
jgi:hypothetical protein